MVEPVLRVEGLSVGYQSGPAIVSGLSLALLPGQLMALLGTNGAGKSTAMKAIAGAIKPRAGHVLCAGQDLTGMAPWLAARAGMGYVPQRQNVFEGLTVRDNFGLGARACGGRKAPDLDWVLQLFPELAPHLARRAGVLSGGLRQMVAIGRALLGAPLVLVLDEPAAGLSGQAAGRLFNALTQLKRQVPILLVEQNVRAALNIADSVSVMAGGKLQLTTTADDPQVTTILAGELAV